MQQLTDHLSLNSVVSNGYLTPLSQYSLTSFRKKTFPVFVGDGGKCFEVISNSSTGVLRLTNYIFSNLFCSWLSMLVVTLVTVSQENTKMSLTGLKIGTITCAFVESTMLFHITLSVLKV